MIYTYVYIYYIIYIYMLLDIDADLQHNEDCTPAVLCDAEGSNTGNTWHPFKDSHSLFDFPALKHAICVIPTDRTRYTY